MNITAIIPTSPIPCHPSTHIIDRTIDSLRAQLPDVGIIITCDGSPDNSPDYARYCETLEKKYSSAYVIRYPKPVHQSEMLAMALAHTFTPLLVYLEHDWEILPGVPWGELSELILQDHYDYIKLHAGTRIHPAHEHLMSRRVIWQGGKCNSRYQDDNPARAIPIIHTRQYSANPHLAKTDWYRMLQKEYLEGKNDFIENLLHGPLSQTDALMGIYNPMEGGAMQSVAYLDGRGSK